MCVPSVAPDRVECQLREILSKLPSRDDVVPSPRPVTEGDQRAGGRDACAERAQRDPHAREESQWAAARQRLDSVELGPSRTIGFTDRRIGGRIASIVLRECQREALRAMVASSVACGAGLKAYHGFKPGEGYGTILRLVAQLHCGTRVCPGCQASIRRRACARMEIDAKYLASLSVPPYMFGVRDAWELAHAIVCQFVSILRRESKYATRPITGKRRCDRARKRNRRKLARSRVGRGGVRAYSWAKEPQQSGMPHLHILLDCDWLDYGWVREVWASVWGAQDADSDFRRVTSVNGACRYLSEYVAKQQTTVDILAIIKSKRLWTSTKAKEDSASVKWIPDKKTCEEAARWQVNNREEAGAESGWRLEAGKDDSYAIWSIPARAPVWIPTIARSSGVSCKMGDGWEDAEARFKRLLAETDSSIIFEEWLCERAYGKKRANK